MQNQDQLTRNERIRLEALAQAIVFASMRNVQPENVIEAARYFENFIRAADTDHKTQ